MKDLSISMLLARDDPVSAAREVLKKNNHFAISKLAFQNNAAKNSPVF